MDLEKNAPLVFLSADNVGGKMTRRGETDTR